MLQATRMPTFATVVGVAPSTTTMQLGAPDMQAIVADRVPSLLPKSGTAAKPPIVTLPKKPRPVPVLRKPVPAPSKPTRYYMPYASLEDLSSASGLGIINESDAWMTGRPYGLPGTAAIRLIQRPGGYDSPAGYHYDAAMLGDADTLTLNTTLQHLVETQQAQQKDLKRIAFWQSLTGGLVVGSLVLGTTLSVIGMIRNRRRSY